jgi:hypothetical protein
MEHMKRDLDIQVRTDKNISGSEKFIRMTQTRIEISLAQFQPHLTRVVVHLKDESAGRHTPGDCLCALEAFPAGMDPISVTDHADTLESAISGALRKLHRVLHDTFDKLEHVKGSPSMGSMGSVGTR